MKFKIDSYIQVRESSAETDRKAICNGCPKLVEARCTSVECGCPKGSWRINPWTRMNKCPLNLWTREQG